MPSPPPLRRDALERLDAALARLRDYWQMMQSAAQVARDGLESVNAEQLPAQDLALMIQAHMWVLHRNFTQAMEVHLTLRRLQERPGLADREPGRLLRR